MYLASRSHYFASFWSQALVKHICHYISRTFTLTIMGNLTRKRKTVVKVEVLNQEKMWYRYTKGCLECPVFEYTCICTYLAQQKSKVFSYQMRISTYRKILASRSNITKNQCCNWVKEKITFKYKTKCNQYHSIRLIILRKTWSKNIEWPLDDV